MRRIGRLTCLTLLLLCMALGSAGVCFAGGLNLVEHYPKDGSNSSPPQNLGIKLFFDGNVAAKELREDNAKCFALTGQNGEEIPIRVLYKDSEPNYILVIAEPEDRVQGLGADSEYTFAISEELRSLDGMTPDAAQTIRFRTRNTSTDMTVNMVMMGVMLAGMLVYSSVSMRRQARKTEEKDEKSRVNPYKVAKETGKSVEEVVRREEKKKRKVAKKQGGAAGSAREETDAVAREEEGSADGRRVRRVKTPRPISAAGSAYVTGRKAAAEKRAAEEAARRAKGTTNPRKTGSKARKKK